MIEVIKSDRKFTHFYQIEFEFHVGNTIVNEKVNIPVGYTLTEQVFVILEKGLKECELRFEDFFNGDDAWDFSEWLEKEIITDEEFDLISFIFNPKRNYENYPNIPEYFINEFDVIEEFSEFEYKTLQEVYLYYYDENKMKYKCRIV